MTWCRWSAVNAPEHHAIRIFKAAGLYNGSALMQYS